ncbi:MAG: DUF2934 domain-containing protein [Acidobacteriota bacterium]
MTTENLEELREQLLREERVQQMVRARAYEIYQMRGGQPGWESHDWFQAEGEVLAFLIADESRREDEKTIAETAAATTAPEAATTKQTRPRPASNATAAKKAAPEKTTTKQAASKKPESKPKAKPTRRSSTREESDQ